MGKNAEGRTSVVKKFADEVYRQCVDMEWTVEDFRLFAQFIEMHKESVSNEVLRQVRSALLLKSC